MNRAFVLSIVFAIATVPTANAWQKIVDCNKGEFVLDEKEKSGTESCFQFVARGGLASDFTARGAITEQEVNSSKEFIQPIGVHSVWYETTLFKSWISYPDRMANVEVDWRNGNVRLTINQVKRNGESVLAKAVFSDCWIR